MGVTLGQRASLRAASVASGVVISALALLVSVPNSFAARPSQIDTLNRQYEANLVLIERAKTEQQDILDKAVNKKLTVSEQGRFDQLSARQKKLLAANESIVKQLAAIKEGEAKAREAAKPKPEPPKEQDLIPCSEWSSMIDVEQERLVNRMIADLRARGVPVRKSTAHYIKTLGDALASHPNWNDQPLSELFLRAVASEERGARKAIRRLSS